MQPAKPPSIDKVRRKGIIYNIILLFGLLIAAIIGNAVYSTFEANKNASHNTYEDLNAKLNIISSIQDNEIDKLGIISGIVIEQRQLYCDFLDYDNVAAITSMLKTLASIHDLDLVFIFDEYGDLLTTYPKGIETRKRSIYNTLISDRKERVDVEKMSAAIVAQQIPEFKLGSNDDHILCFKSVIHLLSDVGDIYAYVVLLKLINGNKKLAEQMADIAEAEIVYYDQDGNTVLTSFKEPKIPYPTESTISLQGETYFVSTRGIKDFAGQAVGNLALALDNKPFFEQRMRLLLSNLLPLLVAAIISISLFVLLKVRVFNRINQLIAALRDVRRGEGDLSIRLRTTPEEMKRGHPDEMEQIFIEFNHMMDKLEDTHAQMIAARKGIEEVNRELEKRVEERTLQLMEINENLELKIEERNRAEGERARLETQLQQAQKMEAIGTLAGGIAHDFNNLLMAIQGRTSIMLMNKDSSHPDFGHLRGIEDHVENAADLTMQLLGFARGGKYEVRPTDINEVIKKQNRMFGRTKKEITIRGKYEKDLWSVEVDRGQIEQVLLNLYVNAWQAMPGGGDLYLETENVTLDENYVKPFSIEPGRYVKISVTDTGVGMDKATQERIFEPFFTTKEMGRGTGLGLASVYGIIKNHGGFINVYSEKGEGATFNIYLPASEREVIEEKKPAGDTLRGTETVLFVDDEDMIIEVAEELLEQLGYKVLTARSGKEAIETYEKNKEQIDIAILDMIMPDMSGGETYDKLKEINPDIKVLLASGYSLNGAATEILDRGCNGFIQKPAKMRELSQKLREILDS